jgi:hypothetical protein
MLRRILLATVSLLAGSAVIANAGPKEDVAAAAKKLADSGSYAWKTTVESTFPFGSGGGRIQKDGLTMLTLAVQDNDVQVYFKGDKGAVKTEDGWKSFEELSQDQAGGFNPGTMGLRSAQNFKTPAAQAEEAAGKTENLQKSGDAYSGTLTTDAVTQMMTFGRRGRGGAGAPPPPAPKNAKGSVKFWVRDGVLAKVEYTTSATINFQGEDRDFARTTTMEFSDVGSAKVDPPAEAKAKMK